MSTGNNEFGWVCDACKLASGELALYQDHHVLV